MIRGELVCKIWTRIRTQVIAAIVVALFPQGNLLAQEAIEVDDTLAKWARIAESTVTAKLKCRAITIVGGAQNVDQAPTRDEVNAWIHDVLFQIPKSADLHQELDAAWRTFQQEGNGILSGTWGDLSLVVDGDTLKNDMSMTLRDGVAVKRSRVRTADEEIEYNSTVKQAMIRDRGSRVKMDSLADLRYIPVLPQYLGDPEVSITAEAQDRAVLNRREHRIEFDPRSGFVYHVTWMTEPTVAYYDYWQDSPVTIAEGQVFAEKSARLFYRKAADNKSRLLRASIYFLESVRLNEEVTSTELAVPVPEGTRIVKAHGPNASADKPIVRRARTAIESVKDFNADEPPPAITTVPKPRSVLVYVIANAIAAGGCGLWWILRRRARSASA